jgi:uncharacterized protein (DUF427 family)
MTVKNNRRVRAEQESPEGAEMVWAEPTERHVRVFFGGEAIADSIHVLVVFKGSRPPVYYFPLADVRGDLFFDSATVEEDPRLGSRSHATLRVAGREGTDAVFRYLAPIPDGPDLSEHVSFEWDAMDGWFEEDEEIYRHPRDPYKRVDVLHSARHVRVLHNGTVLADSQRPMLLFETGLPVRYYLPKLDVAMERLRVSATRSRCPYKGEAVYWDVEVDGEVLRDFVWSYPAPIPELPKVENLLAFYNEKVDLEVDGVLLERPYTTFS